MMFSALPVFTNPALKVNAESRIVPWHIARWQCKRGKNIRTKKLLLNKGPLDEAIF
jgi:hypothetical protein